MKRVYLDNGSTSFPKAPGVAEAMSDFVINVGCNIGRGGYGLAYDLSEKVYETRELICRLVNFDKPQNVVFTPNVTFSLNYVIKGRAKAGDHILISGIEHNAVARPIEQLRNIGVSYDIVPCNPDGTLMLGELEKMFKAETKMVVMTHGSNVSGTLIDVAAVGKICKAHGVDFVLDSAQTAGLVPVDFYEFGLSALCLTGHKGLLGPQGIGALLITDEIADKIDPLVAGGTGSLSDSLAMPSFMPDRLEAGTLNLPGIIGLNASLKYVLSEGPEKILERELFLAKQFISGVSSIPGIELVGRKDLDERVATISIDCKSVDNAELSYILDEKYGIMTRCGLHCAPIAHKTFGTFPQGTVRFAFGYGNTPEEVDYTLDALEKIVKQYGGE